METPQGVMSQDSVPSHLIGPADHTFPQGSQAWLSTSERSGYKKSAEISL